MFTPCFAKASFSTEWLLGSTTQKRGVCKKINSK